MARGTYVRTKYINSSIGAFYAALNAYNQIKGYYRNEEAIILMTNAVELIAKAVLLKLNKSIKGTRKGDTISAEQALSKLKHFKEITEIEEQSLQQLISLRNEAVHSYLPHVPANIMQHLLFTSFKTFQNLILKHSKDKKDIFDQNFLSISLDDHLTYADSVESLLKNFRKGSPDEKKLIWLLERGVAFEGTNYLTQDKFEKNFLKSKSRLLDRVKLGEYLKNAEQLKVIFVQAPRGYTIDQQIYKSTKKQKIAISVMTKKTDIEKDYPYLTSDLAGKIGKNINFTAKAVRDLKLFGDERYHQSIRSSKSGKINRYSDAALSEMKKYLENVPTYNPHH